MGRQVFLGVAAIAVIGVVVMLVAACGGSSNSSGTTTTNAEAMQQWANSLCSSANAYVSSLKSLGTNLQGGGVTKSSINGLVDDAQSATQTFADDVKSLGSPPVTNSEAKKVLENTTDALSKDAQSIKDAISNVSSAADILGAATTITATISSARTQVSSAYDQIKQLDPKGDIQKAFTSAPDCKSLIGSS